MKIKLMIFFIVFSSNLFSEEKLGIYFIPHYQEENALDHKTLRYWHMGDNTGQKKGFLTIYGISNDEKLFYATAIHYETYYYIYDLKENKIIWNRWNYMYEDDYLEDITNAIIEYGIVLFNENIPIEKFPISINNSAYQLETRRKTEYESEIYMVDSANIELLLTNKLRDEYIELGTVFVDVLSGTWVNMIDYYFVRSPFNQNKISVIMIIDKEYGGNYDMILNEYLVFGFDLDKMGLLK